MTKAVHVIDDDEGVLDSAGLVLANAGFAVETHHSAAGFLADAQRSPAGCIVTDLRMPRMSGFELLAHLAASGRHAPVIIMTAHADVRLAVEAKMLGALDVLEKPFGGDALISAVKDALARNTADRSAEESPCAKLSLRESLSQGEVDVFARLASGLTNRAIAAEMGVSDRVVEVHRARLMKKAGARSLFDLVRIVLNGSASPADVAAALFLQRRSGAQGC
jgi:two-component system response regulator FixJ